MASNKAQRNDERLPFQEQMKLAPLPSISTGDNSVKRYMSQRAAWITGSDLPLRKEDLGPGFKGKTTYGGHVYSQSGLAASRTLSESLPISLDGGPKKQFGIHTMHGFFSEAGLADRPFVYEVATIAANPSFYNLLVTVRQPTKPSASPSGDYYTLADAELPLGPVCFSAVVSFRPRGPSQLRAQEPSVQSRFSEILSSRPPSAWDPAPLVDITSIVMAWPTRDVGTFPAVDMKKVDLTAFNEGKPLHERRELLLYRLIAPLPETDPDSHIMTHAFEADRNGLLMIGNHVGFGLDFGRAASLSYSFVVHVNPLDAVMKYGDDEWWIQEASFPRVEAGRGIIMSKIWSPAGIHVATEYQDGIIQRSWRPDEKRGKL
ncbi:acyl-thioesterase [Xylariales sp. AK1849]|nr:acyl-thioesterase [Xylariales sp. AK1849]